MKEIISALDMTEMVENTLHKFGEGKEYFPCYITTTDGFQVPALFTEHQIDEAIERAEKNPEDIKEDTIEKTFWEILFGL